ncbi:MAG: Calx-beta domain-containing protein, partial [Acidimicrobiia bacterium]
MSASDDTATETGPTAGSFAITRTGDLSAELDVHYTVTGTATSGDDYVALTGTATFATDQAISIVTVTPVDDTEVEGDETDILTLDTDTAYTIGDNNQATITISDNDQEPLPEINVTASDDTATEEGPTTGVYTFTRTGDLSAELDVHYAVTGTATSGDDYVALTGTATFAT